MYAEIRRRIRLHDCPPALAADLCARSSFANPEWVKRVRRGQTAHWLPQTLNLWDAADDGTLLLPAGILGDLRALAPDCRIEDLRHTLPPVAFAWRGALRDYQREACRAAFDAGGGVVVGPCGSGKTQMGLALVAACRQPALWIVHTKDLARQAMERAAQVFDLPAAAIGFVGDGRLHFGSHLTVATVQTLIRLDLPKIGEQFGCVVVDEAHRCPADTHLTVMQHFAARYRFGLTATPVRADGLGPMVFAVLGPIVATLHGSELSAAGQVLMPEVRRVQTAFRCSFGEDYGALLDALCANWERNAMIAGLAAGEARDGHTCLVLSERVGHCAAMFEALGGLAPDVPAAVLTGGVPDRRRAEALRALRDGRLRVLFATKLADEGLDVPALDRLFLTTGGRHPGRVEQQIGRTMRPVPGKPAPVVFDFVDARVGVLAAQARVRVRDVYERMGLVVRTIPPPSARAG